MSDDVEVTASEGEWIVKAKGVAADHIELLRNVWATTKRTPDETRLITEAVRRHPAGKGKPPAWDPTDFEIETVLALGGHTLIRRSDAVFTRVDMLDAFRQGSLAALRAVRSGEIR